MYAAVPLKSDIFTHCIYIYIFKYVYNYIYIYRLCANDLSAVTAVATCAAKTTAWSVQRPAGFPMAPTFPSISSDKVCDQKCPFLYSKYVEICRNPPSNDFQGFCLILQRFQSLELCIRHVHFTIFYNILLLPLEHLVATRPEMTTRSRTSP